MGDSKYLDIIKSLNLPKVDVAESQPTGESKYSDIIKQIGVERRKEQLPGAGAPEAAGETAGAAVSSALTPFGYERGAATMLYLYQKVFGQPGEAEFFSRLGGMEAMDKEAQAAGGVRDTVGRTLAGMTAATVRGAATTLEMVVPDSVDPMSKVEGFARGMAKTAAVTSDTFTDKVTAAVTNGVGNIALGVFAPQIAAPLFFFQGAGGAANEYDNAFVEGKLTTKDGIYRPSGKYIAALKGGVIEAATEWFGAKMAKNIAKTRWGKDMTLKMRDMNPAMKFATGLGTAYAMEGGEEGAASLAYSFTRGLQGEEFRGYGNAVTEALTDAFYGGFGGAGAHPFIAVAEASQAKIMRDRISAEIRKSNGPFSDEKFWDAMPRATVDALKAMDPAQREAELQTAHANYHQANADRQVGATALNDAASALEKAQKKLKTASKLKDQAKIDEAQKAVDAAQVAYDGAFANQATLGAELLSARTRLITIAAFNARNAPVIEKTTADVLSELKFNPSAATTDSDKAAEAQIRELGYDIQFFESSDPNADPAFYSPSAPNTIFLKSGMTNAEMLDGVVFAHHEAMHIIQATDGDLYSAMRKAFDEQSVVQAGVEYFNDKLRKDDRLAQRAAASTAEQVAGVQTMPMQQGEMIEQRAGRTLLQAEGQARVLEDGVRALLRTGKAPGFLGELIVKMGLRGRQAATALRVRKMMLEAAAKRGKIPSAVGKPVNLTEFGKQIEEAKGVLRGQQMLEKPPAAPSARPAPAAAPAAAAAAPSAAPVPPSASAAALTASGMTPAEAAAAQTPDFKAMVNLAVNALRKTDKKWAEGKRLYPIAEQMERDPAALSPEDRKIGEELRSEMTSQFGKDYAVLWARARGPAATVEQKREKKSGRFVGAPKWIGKSPVKLEKLRAKLRQLAMEGEAGKMWYENSSRAILAAANGDIAEAEKIVALIAIYSPNATVPANTSMALTAYYQWKAGVPINAGFSKADEKATDLLVNGKAWSGIKTNSFYQNLMVEIDPSKLDPGVATMDMWMALAFDYGDKALDQGPKYVFAENEIRRLADELGWKPHQVQAAIWTAMKGRIDPIRGELKKTELRRGIGAMVTKVDPKTKESKEVYRIVKGREYDHFRLAHKMGMMYSLRQEDIAASKYDFSNAINDRMVQMSWEATPSTVTGRSLPGIHRAPIEQQFEYLKEIMDVLYVNGRDVIADLVGLPQGTTITGFSAWMGKIGAGAQTFVPVPLKGAGQKRTFTPEAKKLLNLAALVRAFVMEQDSVVYHTPIWDDAKIRHNGVQIYTPRPLNRAEMTALYDALQKKFGTTELAPGYRNDGARVLNFTKIPNKQIHDGLKEVIEQLPVDFGGGNVRLETFRSEGEYIGNDWSENPNGESYLDRIESLQPNLLGRVRSLRSDVQAVNQRFDTRYGWSTLAARRRGTPRDRVEQPSAGALSPLAGTPVIRGFSGPDPVIVAVAERYAASRGITLRRQSEYADVDLDRARRIADAYDKMEHNPQDPAVAEAYAQLIEQTTAQYQALVDAGYEFYFVDLDNDPYADQPGGFGNPYNAVRDLRANRRMAVFPTESGFGSGATDLDVSNNPLLADTGLQWSFGRPGGPLKRVTANDLFRAVHDAMGHSLEGAGFRARGEENAWQAHVRLFTGSAIGAMTSETRGQNSWLNFGPFGEKNRDAKVEDTTFADQKVGLMPSWTWEEGRVGSVLSARLRADTSKEITDAFVAEGAKFADILVALQDAVKATVALHKNKDRTSEDKEFGRVLDLSESIRVDTYKSIRANWSSYRDDDRGSMELKDNQLPVSMQSGETIGGTTTKKNDGGLVFAHEMMHAATSLRLDSYARSYADKKVKESGYDRYSDLGMRVAKQWDIRRVSGKKYIENLERYSADPEVDPAFKELVDCYLEAAKAVPDQYERMINGKQTTPSVRFNNANGAARIFVRPSTTPILRPELVATLSAESQRDYAQTSLELVVEVGGKEFVVDRRPASKASVIEETAKNLREGKPVLREALYLVTIDSWSGQPTKVSFRQNGVNIVIPGFEPVHEYSGGGLANKDGGDGMSSDGGLYAFGNLHEFVAEAINEPKFQNILRSLPSKGRGSGSMFSRLMQALRRFLGIEDTVPMSMLDDLMNLTEELARTDIVAAIGQPQRRAAVPGEIAAPKVKPLTLDGFPVVGGLSDVFKKSDGTFNLTFKLPGQSLDITRPVASRDQPAKVVLYDKKNISVRLSIALVDGKWTLYGGSSDGYGSNLVDYGDMYSPTVFPKWGESATSIDGKPFGKTKAALIKDLAELAKRMVAISSQRQVEEAQKTIRNLQRDGYTNVSFEDKRGQEYKPALKIGSVLSARRSQLDEKYFAAIERNDIPALQRMVDAAARAAGYLIRAKHGSTSPDITAFDFDSRLARFPGKSERGVVWFSDNDEVVRRYASTMYGIDVERVIRELNEDMSSPPEGGVSLRNEDGSYSEPYHTWSNASDRLTVFYLPPESGYQPGYYASTQGSNAKPTHIGMIPEEAVTGLRSWLNAQEGMKKPLTMSEVIYDSYLKLSNPLELDFNGQEKTERWDDIIAKAVAGGHDGLIIKNVIDIPRGMFGSLPLSLEEYKGTVYGIFAPEQAKSADPITRDEQGNIIPLSQRFDASKPNLLYARRRATEDRRDIAASVVLDVARQRLQQLLASLPANEASWSEANRAAVAKARQNVLDAARDLKRKPSRADTSALAYAIGRREGLLSGEVRGQKVAKREEKRVAERMVREERNKQKVEAQAKRTEMRSAFRDRVAGLMLEIESAAAANEELRNRIKVMRKYEKAGKAVAARKAESAVLKAWIKGLYKGRAAGKAEGIAEAKKTMTDIRKAAVQVIATLPPKLRGKYVNAVATMKTAAGINKIARRVVQDLAMAEAIETVAAINRMEKRIKKVGLRAETRTDLRDDLSAARSLLASGRKRMLPFTDTADLASRTEAARRLLESAVQRFDVEREEYRDARDARADEAVADAAALGATLATLPKLKQGRLSSMAPKRGVLKDILSTVGNSDIYTLMQAIEGGTHGVLGKIWAGFSEAKGNMTLDRKRIDEKIDAAIRSVGYSGYDGYATNAAGLYGESSAETVTVTLGGNPMTITVDQMLHLAAFDDDTVALLTDETDPTGTPGAPIVFSTYRNSPRIYMTRQEFADIRSNLTNGQRQLIDQMKAILEQDIRPRAFDIHFQIHGRQPDLVAGYFPRQRLGDEISGEAIDVNAMPSAVMNTMLSNAGFLQQRVAAKSTLVVGGMMRTMDSHLDESLRLIHLSMPLRYAMSVLKNGEVRAGIESTMGDGGNDMIRKLVLNGVGLSGRAQGGLIEGINANISGALITLNPKTWLRQLGGAFRLMSEMPTGAWAKGMAQMIAMTPAQRRDMAREIESMNGYFYDRHRRSQVGIFANVLGDPNTAKDRWAASFASSARSMSAVGESLAAGKFARAARDIREGVLPISRVLKTADGVLRMVDRQIMLAAFLGSRADVMASNPGMTPAEVNVAAAKLAELAFRKTQNVSDPLDDTVYAAQQKFSQGIGRLMFPFSSDPLKGYNQIRRAASSGDPALIAKTAVGVTSNMALSAAVNPLWTAAGIAIANALGGGGDEEDEEMIKQMAMEQEYSYIQPRLASDAAAAVFGYLGMLGGGIVDGALGSAERADDVMEPLVVRFFGDISQYAAKGDFPSLSSTAMQMAGIPVVAPATTVTGVLKKAAPSDRKLLEYYRKLDKAGKLNPSQRQRLNVLAARERIRLAQERREKQMQE